LDNQFQFAILATEDRIRDMQLRKGLLDGNGKRIYRIGRERQEIRPAGRR
jgi:hypothetical protein